MTENLKAVFFDLDGTLLDTAPDFARVLNSLCDKHGRPPVPYASIRATVSHGARALVTLAFQLREGEQGFEPLRLQLLELYQQQLAVETRPFAGIPELLEHIESAGMAWGIVTNKPRIYTEAILSALQLNHRCQAVVCPDDVNHTKPHPEALFLACEKSACTPAQAIYIGDHRRDIEAGRNAGMKTITAAYGYIEPEDSISSWQADYCINHPAEAIPIFQRYAGL